jgi:hypothetical protein
MSVGSIVPRSNAVTVVDQELRDRIYAPIGHLVFAAFTWSFLRELVHFSFALPERHQGTEHNVKV